MAFDGVFLHCLIEDIKDKLLNTKIDKINQPEKDEIYISFRGIKGERLLISASSNFPRIHFTKITKDNPLKAPMFCMVLRKYLIGGKIINIYQPNNDRILHLDIETTDELGFNSIYTLIIEIMGRHSNISLVRKRDNKIIESIKHITSFVNSYRTLLPNVSYVSPPPSNKLNPFDFHIDEFEKFFSSIEINENFYMKSFNGISKLLSKELYLSFDKYSKSLENLYNEINLYFKNIHSKKSYNIFCNNNGDLIDFYSLPISYYDDKNLIHYDDGCRMLDEFYSKKDMQDRLQNRSSDLQKLIITNIDRCLKKDTILLKTLKECEEKEKLRIYGDLLTSFIYSFKKGDKEVTLCNFFDDNKEITITLNENKTPSENIQYYYKKYNKLKKSEEAAIDQREKNSLELEYLNSVLTNLKNSESYDEIEEIKEELISSGYIKYKKNSKKNKKPSKPYHFLSSDGFDIYVGKNNIQNDYLTLKFADKYDTWMHTKNIPGSHVIIKGKNISDKALEEAAILAAFYSKGKNSSKVAVDYTEVKNVKKPSGAKPGMVIYSTNKTIYVDPVDLNLEKH
ncbi:Rqc2 family fibronectin-binding protein [Clostridium fallax]|uniref:Rqc2 homolog RqcH n=1 Tax=Clostridium fallax TaxID=1533 RepID=A0A1M4YIF5_9CLOT|nr:NFACT RNA binding domain-containing protein [Clostridium fallax]SHF05403.1 Predicted component of the ribosome quality control (RQC) complex, YloA/Tae2 family, contains fibronectin-binding (FbpA) and DUF814 domains [Clostridium fallax]SQB06320.1 fibronectin-binding protein [Clostridium fallax]